MHTDFEYWYNSIPVKSMKAGMPMLNAHRPILNAPKDGQNFGFASIGECMVEMAPMDTSGEYRMGYAGDTFNTAWYMRTLRPDVNTRYITRVGSDDPSDEMLGMMARAGIDTSQIGRCTERSVGLYLISLKDGERSFSYWRDRSAAKALAQDPAKLSTAIDNVDLVYFSGISLAILDPKGRKALLEVLKSARALGKTIAFDSNLRPGLWGNVDEMTNAIMEAAAVSDIVLPSYDDEATFFKDSDIKATCARYLDAGAKTLVVKNGAGPIYYAHEGQSAYVSPQVADQIVDTTSAGDSFNAGFFAGLDQAKPIEHLIQTASQVAAQVIGRKGALVQLDLGKITI